MTDVVPPLRVDSQSIRGWRNEFRCWWRMAKYVNVVFDKSRNGPGSTSICRNCCQILSIRTCNGDTVLSAKGCKFHRSHPDIPFAVTTTITSARLREMLRPNLTMTSCYLNPDHTDLMNLGWVKRIREDNDETSQPRKLYQHFETCLHGTNPTSIVQGKGLQGIYWKRCDGRYFSAVGVELHVDDAVPEISESEESKLDLEVDGQKIAENAWRRCNPDEEDDEEAEEEPKRSRRCIVM